MSGRTSLHLKAALPVYMRGAWGMEKKIALCCATEWVETDETAVNSVSVEAAVL